jgi:hypothetical protein
MRSLRFSLMTLLVATLTLGGIASAQRVVVDFWHGMTGGRLSVLEQDRDASTSAIPTCRSTPS